MKKLVGFITASLPDKNFTIDLILKLKESEVDSIELGIPFSDPVADGETIELASLKAIQSGFKMADIFDISKIIAKEIDLLWMGYFNSFYKKGFENMFDIASKLNVSGFIIPDMPYEESLKYLELSKQSRVDLINFVAPTDSKERISTILKHSQKFIYLVAYAGITGSAKKEDLSDVIKNIKDVTQTPLYIGFGVNKESAFEKSRDVDGVIVGSAFVKYLLDESLTNSEKINKIATLAKEIKEIINS